MNFRKKTALFLGFTLTALSIAACSGETIDSQPQDTSSDREVITNNYSSQKTYQNKEFAFSFSYPNNYILENKDIQNISLYLTLWDKKDYQYMRSPEGKKENHPPGRYIDVLVYPNPERLSALEWAKTSNMSGFNSVTRQGEAKNINIAGQSGISYISCGLYCGDTILFTARDNRYVFSLFATSYEESDPILKDFETVKSTFKLE